MRLLLIHNRYRQPGGEDAVFADEASLLESRGHTVTKLLFDNSAIPDHRSPLATARFAAETIWSRAASQKIRETVRDVGPDIVHFHNTFPLISPAAYYAVHEEAVPVVQTLHNYRLLCPNALFFRDGHICEDCMGKLAPWPGIRHACYRNSRSQTVITAAMLTTHRLIGSWTQMVDAFIALTEFSRRKFVQGGLPAERVIVKPNFVLPDASPGEHQGNYALFVGRLSMEKGIETLLRAWERLRSDVPLRIVGDGPLSMTVAKIAKQTPEIEWLGQRSAAEVSELMGNARMVIVPSEWYETFGRVVIEAYAKGTPVIGAKIGAIAELIKHGRTGLLFSPGNATDLEANVQWAWTHPEELVMMGLEARSEYEAKYTAGRNYEMLMEIYERGVARVRERFSARGRESD